MHQSEKLLRKSGSLLLVRYSSKPLVDFKQTKFLGPKDDNFIYQNSFLVAERFNSDGDSRLYVIDVKQILACYPLGYDVDDDGHYPVVLEWTWRPVAKSLLYTSTTNTSSNLGWEIRTRSKEGESVLASGSISSSSCIGISISSLLLSSSSSSSLFLADQFHKPSWSTCQATLSSIPNRGSIEVWITTDKGNATNTTTTTTTTTTNTTTKRGSAYAAAEGNNFNVKFVPVSALTNVCGDNNDWSDSINRFSSIKGYNFNNKVLLLLLLLLSLLLLLILLRQLMVIK